MRKAISIFYNLLFILVPFVFYAKTSEVFEFNKMITIYIFTILIIGTWLIRMVIEKQIIFRRTILDIPLLIFLGSQLISAIFSIDPRTSWLGYYSRFNGGLLSSICYSVLYWAFVSNLDGEATRKIIAYSLLPSALIVSVYGILEHFGGSISCLLLTGTFDDACWVQDVRTRVFATLGQPNWMAAYLVALLPLAISKSKSIFWLLSSVVIFAAILFTKSRSGLLALAAALTIFTGWQIVKGKITKQLILVGITFVIVIAIFGTPWTNPLFTNHQSLVTTGAPAPEEGGTESGDIRKIVWKGAINIWKAYPIFGTGSETFAFTYYMYRPVEHNLVSEWDFLYNKAHNEYLNYLANTGIFGLGSYLVLIGFSIYLLRKNTALLAGYVSILITNFFGFSVVITQLLLFLFPAMAITCQNSTTHKKSA